MDQQTLQSIGAAAISVALCALAVANILAARSNARLWRKLMERPDPTDILIRALNEDEDD